MNSAAMLGLSALTLTLAGSPAMSTEAVASTYLLAMQIHDGDRLVGSPKLTIAAGQPLTIEIADKSGDHYNMTVTVTSRSGEILFMKSTIDVVSGGVHHALTPSMLVALNESSSIKFGIDSAISKPIRVDFTLNKVR